MGHQHNPLRRKVEVRLLLLLAVLFIVSCPLLVSASSEGALVHPEVMGAINLGEEMEVMVLLKDGSGLDYSDVRTGLSRRDVYETRKTTNKGIQKALLSKIKEDHLFEPERISLLGRWFSGRINQEILQDLRRNSAVQFITPVYYGEASLQESIPLINATSVWGREVNGVNISGKDQTVCLIDTGVNKDHPNLLGKVIAEKCYCVNSSGDGCCPGGSDEGDDASDDNGHGTSLAGIISANGSLEGVAPETKIVSVKALDSRTKFRGLDVSNAVEWCVDHADQYNISVISTSFGSHQLYGTIAGSIFCDVPFGLSFIEAKSNGLFVSAASGNKNNTDKMATPACSPFTVSVGATNDLDEVWQVDFWNGTNRNKALDLLAPGSKINSTSLSESDYSVVSGTSYSAPHVAGAAALLLQRDSSLKPDQIKNLLQDTGVPIYDSATGLTFKRIDVGAAMDTYYPLIPSITDRDIENGQTLTFDLDVQNKEGKELVVIIDWNTINELDLVLQKPNGQNITAASSRPEGIITDALEGSDMGLWKVHVSRNDVSHFLPIFTDFTLFTNAKASSNVNDVKSGVDSNTGGVNFSDINLNYVSTCSSDDLEFVMKGEETQSENHVDFVNQTTLARDAFLTGLTIPDTDQWISLPIMVNGISIGGDAMGVPEFLATDTANALLEADVELKYDMFQDSQSFVEQIYEEWKLMVQNSTYWPQMQAQGFNTFPTFAVRTWITPTGITANGTECKVFIQNSTLGVDVVMEGVWLDLSEYAFTSEITAELETLKQNWTDQLFSGYLNYSNITRDNVNNNSEYAELRTVYNSLALAQWYKNQDWSQVPYGDVIDTSNTSALQLNTSFNQSYWEQQAWQELYTFEFTDFLGGTQGFLFHGGIELSASELNVSGNLTNTTEVLIENATTNAVAQEGDNYYFGITQVIPKPDIVPTAMWVNSSLTPDAGENVLLTATIENQGGANTTDSLTVYFYYSYTYPNGYTTQELIGSQTITNLNTSTPQQASVGFSSSDLGEYNITVVVDYNSSIEETSEINNQLYRTITVVDPNPTAFIEAPENGQQTQQDEVIVFAGLGTDFKDSELNESLYNWTSDVDGFLGNSSVLYTNLSLGDHVIFFTVQDSDGNTDTSQVLISVVPSEPPVVTLNGPINGQAFQEGEMVYFSGEATDHEDGQLTGASLLWNSSLDGALGTGETLSTSSLAVGAHTITFFATDSSDVTVAQNISITIDESTPNVTIHSPLNSSNFYYTQSNVTFNGSANDPHEGDISEQLNWTSNLDDSIGIGSLFSQVLTQGTHLISAFVTDGVGLTGLDQIYLTILPPQPPIVSIITPTNAQEITNGPLTLRGSAVDPETGNLSGNSLVWTSSLDGALGNGTEVNLTQLTVGTHNITLNATESDGLSVQSVVSITIDSAAPSSTILSPSSHAVFSEGDTILFNSSTTDLEDGVLTGNDLAWHSSRDGNFGNGEAMSISNLSVGAHTITLIAKDSDNTLAFTPFSIVIIGQDSVLVTQFSDGTSDKLLNYSSAGQKVVYVEVPKGATIDSATLDVGGFSREE